MCAQESKDLAGVFAARLDNRASHSFERCNVGNVQKRSFMNNHNGWMGGTNGSGIEMWIWPVIGVLVVILLVVLILRVAKK